MGQVEKDSFIALPGKGGHRGFLLQKTMCLNPRGFDEGVYNNDSRVGVSDRIMVAQMIKRLPAMWETQVCSSSWEDPLEKEMATHSSTLAWKIPWIEEPGRLQSIGSQRIGH